MNAIVCKLLGFDARLLAEGYLDSEWSDDRREVYLLDSKVSWPLSVDPLVWPSLFDYQTPVEVARPLDSLITVAADPSLTDSGFWLELDPMNHALATAGVEKTVISIAVCIFAAYTLLADVRNPTIVPRHPVPSHIPAISQFVGYDIADSGFISALSNCGYSPEEKTELLRYWSEKLNGYGLLKNFESATEFRLLADRRVPEHAPFSIFGIYLISSELNYDSGR